MQSQSGSRKRPAPGASPMASQQTPSQPQFQFEQNNSGLADQFTNQFGADGFPNPPFDASLYSNSYTGTQSYPSVIAPSPSTQLVRRNTNQQLTPKNPGSSQEHWMGQNQDSGTAWELNDSDQDLDRKAAMAKKDAQAKRKQIPPFVLKLWSFLNDNKNTDLIKWTDEGTAFTVLDEDEFARTLIPELFKHNNYASFVRQLNMYGFHKKVGLNANSMKAAEKKTKDPNVYWHDYFRRGREDLLWLIQKPQSKSAAAKRKRGQDSKENVDSDDEKRASPDAEDRIGSLRQDTSDVAPLPKSEVSAMRQEITRLQRQQSVISKIITQLKDQNEQFYRQASEFQNMHERHENSINAILTFLATFYKQSMEAGVNINSMFGNLQQQGTVVDVGDGEFAETANTNNHNSNNNNNINNQQLQRYRRPQLLLEGSPVRDTGMQPGAAVTQPSSNRSTASPMQDARRARSSLGVQSATPQPPSTSASPVVKDDADTPNVVNQFPENDEMMSLINAANANSPSGNSPQFDFTRALNHAQNANGQTPLTMQQRNEMLNLIASQAGGSGNSNNNALSNPNPPPIPSLDQYARTQKQLEMLTRLQREQDSKVQDLAGRLQPLSPTGSIPGLHDGYGGAGQLGHASADANPPSDFDLDAFINNGNYFDSFGADPTAGQTFPTDSTNVGQDDDPTGLNFDFGNVDDAGDELFDSSGIDLAAQNQGNRVESVHSSPAENEEEVKVEDDTPSKRLRRR